MQRHPELGGIGRGKSSLENKRDVLTDGSHSTLALLL